MNNFFCFILSIHEPQEMAELEWRRKKRELITSPTVEKETMENLTGYIIRASFHRKARLSMLGSHIITNLRSYRPEKIVRCLGLAGPAIGGIRFCDLYSNVSREILQKENKHASFQTNYGKTPRVALFNFADFVVSEASSSITCGSYSGGRGGTILERIAI